MSTKYLQNLQFLFYVSLTSSLAVCAEPCPRPTPVSPPVASQAVEKPPAKDPASQPEKPPYEVRVAIVGTSDLHGYVEGRRIEVKDRAGQPHRVRCGGLPLLGGYLDNLRARMPVLLLDGGDMFQGTMVSNLGEGQVVVDAYNVLGYHAVAIGNHEFDYGPAGPRAVPHPDGGDDPTGALKARAAAARFPFLSANLLDKKTSQPVGWENVYPATQVEIAGIPIGIVGALTEDTPYTTNSMNLRDVTIAKVEPAVRAQAAALRKAGAAAVILTIHEGANCQSFDNPRDIKSCQNNDERILTLVRALDGAVDAVVGGHTHAGVAHFVGDVPIIQSFSYGNAFGRVDLVFTRQDSGPWHVDRSRSRIYPPTELADVELPALSSLAKVTSTPSPASTAPTQKSLALRCDARFLEGLPLLPAEYEGRRVIPNAAVEAALHPHVARAIARANSSLGVTLAERLRRNFRNESPLSQLMADLIRMGASRILGTTVDIAVQNGGGIRNDLPAGALTYGQVFEVQPFDNRLAIVRLTGAQIAEVFRRNLTGGHGVLVPSGVRVEAHCNGPEVQVLLRRENGAPLEPSRTYTIAMSDFLASGGDNFADVLPVSGAPPREPRVTFYDDVLLRELIVEELTRYRGPLLKGTMQSPRLVLDAPRPLRCPIH